MGEVVPIDLGGDRSEGRRHFSEKAFAFFLRRNAVDHDHLAALEELETYVEHFPDDRRQLDYMIQDAIDSELYAIALYGLEFRRRLIGDAWSVAGRDRAEVADRAVEIAAKASLHHDAATQNLAEQMLRLVQPMPPEAS